MRTKLKKGKKNTKKRERRKCREQNNYLKAK